MYAAEQNCNGPTDRYQELVKRAMAGDKESLNQLLIDWSNPVRNWAAASASADEADDVSQDVLLILHAKLPELKSVDSFPGWIRSITKRRCWSVDHQRRRRQGNRVELDEIPDRDHEWSIDESLDGTPAEQLHELIDGYALQNPRAAEIVRATLTGESITDSAASIGISRGLASTARSRFASWARERLANQVE